MVINFYKLLLCGCLTALAACQGQPRLALSSSLAGGRELVLEQVQSPWSFTLRYLPGNTAELTSSTGSPSVAGTSTTTATFKLRVKSQDARASIPELLQTQAPQLTPEQQQNLLFYHMAEAGHLQLGSEDVRPVTAYVEMSPQRAEFLDIVFVFALPEYQLSQAADAAFVLDKAFFLAQPLQFAFPATQLISVVQ